LIKEPAMSRQRILMLFCLFLTTTSVVSADPFPITWDWFGADGASRTDTCTALHEMGFRHFGINGKSTNWCVIQPKENDPYDFSMLDEKIHNITDNFKNQDVRLEFGLRCNALWATKCETAPESSNSPHAIACHPPQGEYPNGKYWKAWGDFVRAVVERYDGDGVDDMPGLKYNILYNIHLEDEIDSGSHWTDFGYTPTQLGQTMKVLYDAVKDACPDVLVMRSGTNFIQLLDDDPDAETAIERLKEDNRALLIGECIQNWHDTFDAFGTHPNFHYTGIMAHVRYVNALCEKYGKPTKPIIASDMNSTLHNFSLPKAKGPEPWYLNGLQSDVDKNFIDDPVDVLMGNKPLGPLGQYNYDAVKAQYQGDQANQIIKKLTLGMAAGYKQMFVSQVVDWPGYFIFIWKYGGIFDIELLKKTDDILAPGVAKPYFYALKFWLPQFVGTTSAQLVHKDFLNNNPIYGTWVVKLAHPYADKYVMWSDKPKGDTYTIKADGEFVSIFDNITQQGQKEPHVKTQIIEDACVKIQLDTTPRLVIVPPVTVQATP